MSYMGAHSMLRKKKLRRNIGQCVTPHKVTQYIQLSGSQPEFLYFVYGLYLATKSEKSLILSSVHGISFSG